MDVLPFILWTLWCLTIPAYFVVQLIVLLRTSGTLRWLAALPLAFMVPAYLLFVLGMFQGGDNNLSWPLLILPSPVALLYVVILLVRLRAPGGQACRRSRTLGERLSMTTCNSRGLVIMRLAWVFLACLVLVPLRPVPAQAAEEKEIERLVEQLASDSFPAREAAAKKLVEIGEPALAALEKAKTSDDPEVRVRTAQIISAIAAAIDDKLCVEQLRLTGHKPNPKYTAEFRHGPVTSVSISADGKRLLTSGFDATLRLWDAETGRELRVLEGHTGPILGAALSPDATRALSACVDDSVRLWDVRTGKHLQQMDHRFYTNGVAFSPTSEARVAFGPQGQALSGGGDGTMRLWNLDSGESAGNFSCHSNPRRAAASVVVAYSEQARLAATSGNDQAIRLWDLETGQAVRTIPTIGNVYHNVCFSADGKRLAACPDARPRIFDVETGKELLQIEGVAVLSLAFSPDGKRLVTGGDWGDLSVRICDARTGQELRKYEGHGGSVGCVAFFPDGQRIASASYDGTARIWGAPRTVKLLDEMEGK